MKDLSFNGLLRDPMYAAAIAAGITIIAKWLDNRLADRKGKLVDYLKSALYCGALVGAWVWMLKNPSQTKQASRQFMAPAASTGGFPSF